MPYFKFFTLFFIMISSLNIKSALHYDKKDLNNWSEIDTKTWFSLGEWQKSTQLRENDLYFQTKFITSQKKERVGFVIDCYGSCYLHRGVKRARPHRLSDIKEGDEISTRKNSYLYLFLLDGTLIRLSPESSISLNDIDISPKKVFIHARINNGFVQWIARSVEKISLEKPQETDPLFSDERKTSEANEIFFDPHKNQRDRLELLNEEIKKNNEFINLKETTVFIRTPVGNIFGQNGNFSFYVIFGHETYIKSDTKVSLSLRKRKNPEILSLVPDAWYQINRYGKKAVIDEDADHSFGLAEFLVKRPFTLFRIREKWLDRYSKELYLPSSSIERIYQLGYQMWDYQDYDILKIKFFDLDKKIAQLKVSSDYFEKRNLYSVLYLAQKEKLEKIPFGPSYYHLALQKYLDYISRRN